MILHYFHHWIKGKLKFFYVIEAKDYLRMVCEIHQLRRENQQLKEQISGEQLTSAESLEPINHPTN